MEKTDCINCLRRTADTLEVTVEWLVYDCLHALGMEGSPRCEDSEFAGMDLSIALDALGDLVWWLRVAAKKWEGSDGR